MSTVLLVTGLFVLAHASANGPTPAEIKKEIIEKKVVSTLNLLFDAQPAAQAILENSAGYAVFADFGSNRSPDRGENGRGIAFNNRSGERTFMNVLAFMQRTRAERKKFRYILVFTADEPFDRFVAEGLQIDELGTFAPELTVPAMTSSGALMIEPAVFLYQLTDDGLTAELIAQYTKFYKDTSLNASSQ